MILPALFGKRSNILHHRRRSKSRSLRCYHPNSKAIVRRTTTWIRTMNPRRKKKMKSLCFYSPSRSRDDEDDANTAITTTTTAHRVVGRCQSRDVAMLRSYRKACVYAYIHGAREFLLKKKGHTPFPFSDFLIGAHASALSCLRILPKSPKTIFSTFVCGCFLLLFFIRIHHPSFLKSQTICSLRAGRAHLFSPFFWFFLESVVLFYVYREKWESEIYRASSRARGARGI